MSVAGQHSYASRGAVGLGRLLRESRIGGGGDSHSEEGVGVCVAERTVGAVVEDLR